MTNTENTTAVKHLFVVHIAVKDDNYSDALDSLVEALQDCTNSVEFTVHSNFGIMTGGVVVATHSDFTVPAEREA